MTIKRKDYIDIPYFQKYEKLLNTVSDGHLMRIYAQYKDVWFKDLPKTLSDNKIQFIIPIDYENGLIQISYSDSYNAKFWNNLKNKKEVKKHLKIQLNKMFPNKNIKDPEWITLHYWDAGVHFWKTGINSKEKQKEIIELFKNKKIYILGETYSDRQAWADGALETVEKYLLK
jgi:monoamine oxidase